jgi:predicted Zn-ribbon and HTH transcriptional regulator
MSELIEKSICRKCGIVFKRASECPRCGKSDGLDVYFEAKE